MDNNGNKWLKVVKLDRKIMFRGTSEINFDDKGRCMLPVKMRNIILSQNGDGLIATKDPYDQCILIYPLREWEIIENQLSRLPNLDKENRKVLRVLIGNAHELAIDKSGRVLLPSSLREYAEIAKEAICVGQIKKIELWSLSGWNSEESNLPSRDALKDSLGDLCL